MKLEIEITGCVNCPYLKWGKYYDEEEVCFCEKGAFSSGEKVVPKVPPKKCPYILDFLVKILLKEFGWNISTKKKMLEVFEDFGIEINE